MRRQKEIKTKKGVKTKDTGSPLLLPAECSKGEPRTDWSVWNSDSKSDMEALSGNVSSDISRLSDVPVISLMMGYLVCC